jgi:hypothetical protein
MTNSPTPSLPSIQWRCVPVESEPRWHADLNPWWLEVFPLGDGSETYRWLATHDEGIVAEGQIDGAVKAMEQAAIAYGAFRDHYHSEPFTDDPTPFAG